MLRGILAICGMALTACSRSSAPKSSVREVTGTAVERVAGVTAIFAKHKAPPTAMADAHFLEEQIGDGVLGPSDYRAFYAIQVAPQDVTKWMSMLAPLGEPAEYAQPAQSCAWWVSREEFTSLEFFKTENLTGRHHGWIGVSPQTGQIFIFTFTM